MKTKIYLWSMDGTVDGKIEFNGFCQQAEAYFNKFGHLPRIGDIVKPDSDTSDKVVSVDRIEYRGIEDENFVIALSLTTELVGF